MLMEKYRIMMVSELNIFRNFGSSRTKDIAKANKHADFHNTNTDIILLTTIKFIYRI